MLSKDKTINWEGSIRHWANFLIFWQLTRQGAYTVSLFEYYAVGQKNDNAIIRLCKCKLQHFLTGWETLPGWTCEQPGAGGWVGVSKFFTCVFHHFTHKIHIWLNLQGWWENLPTNKVQMIQNWKPSPNDRTFYQNSHYKTFLLQMSNICVSI